MSIRCPAIEILRLISVILIASGKIFVSFASDSRLLLENGGFQAQNWSFGAARPHSRLLFENLSTMADFRRIIAEVQFDANIRVCYRFQA